MCHIVIWYLHTLWNNHHDGSSNHLYPYKVITVLLIKFFMLSRGATPCPRSGVATESTRSDDAGVAERNCSMYEVRGGGQRGATLHPRSGAEAERSNPSSKEQRLCGRRRAERSYPTFKIRRGDLIQGKEQWLRFAGAAVKRYPMSKVRETQIRR